MQRQRVLTGTIWEERNGYCRALRAGSMIFVSGTLPTDDDGNIMHPSAPFLQTIAALEKIEGALRQLGASRENVVRTRIFIKGMKYEEEVGRAHLEFFRDVMPCCTMVEISGLASPMAIVEVEVDAIVDE
jgi:enamine deaminase RidA (YjgF/YER057c/UK114 family)